MNSAWRPLVVGVGASSLLWSCSVCSAQDVHFRATFEDGKTEGWTPGRAYIDGKPVGTLPEIKLAEAPDQPTYGGSRFALLLEDLVGDSLEACATVAFPPVTVTPQTMVSLALCWDSESGSAGTNMRVPTEGSLKYSQLKATESRKWYAMSARVVDFRRGEVPAREGTTFDSFTVRIFGTTSGWRQLWVDNVVIYEGPDATPPAAVGGVRAVQRGPRIDLIWDEPADDTAVVSYAVHRGREAGFAPTGESLIATTREPLLSDVPGGEGRWFYRVTATDYGGSVSPPSPPTAVEAAVSSLAAPRLMEPREDDWKLAGEAMPVRWEGVPDARGYLLQYAPNARFADAAVEQTPQLRLELDALEPGVWHWRVLALDAEGLGSEFSPARSFAIKRYYDTVRPAAHPRLYFGAEDLPRLRAAMQAEPTRAIWESIKRSADELLDKPLVEYEPGERWGTFLLTCRRANTLLETLSFCYALTGDERYATRAKQQAEVVLSWDCWVDPVHGGAAARADLATGEICRGLGLLYDWVYDALSEEERAGIREVLVARGLVPVFERSVEGAGWSRTHTNWCAVVHGGAGVAALALLGEEPAAAEWLEQFETKIGCYFDAFDSEGGWVEGPGYWGYGMSYALWFIDALRRVTHGERDLYGHERLSKTLQFVLHCTTPDGAGTVNFADSWYGRFSLVLVRRLAAEYQNPFAAELAQRRPGTDIWAFLWHEGLPPARKPTPEELPPAILFPDINWVVLRQGWSDPRDCFFAIKGGTNADWHGHRDMAHFILNAFGKRMIIDQSGGLYRKEYWQGLDYEVQSEGHNTLLLDGKGQERRKEHDAQITSFFHSPDCDYVLCDASRAYGDRLTRFHRHVVYLRPDTFVMFDDIAAPQPTQIESLLHTLGNISREGDVLRFDDESTTLLTRVLLPAPFAHRIAKGTNVREASRDNFIRFGPAAKVRDARFLLAMRPALTREPTPGVLLWEDFERGSVSAWQRSQATVNGERVGALPEIKLAAQPDQPTYRDSKFGLLLEDMVGDSPEICADLRFPPITVTPDTRITLAYRWESESGKGGVNARINAGGLLKYFTPEKVASGRWGRLSARALDFRRGDISTREGEQFTGLTVRLVGTDRGWRRLWMDDVAIHECPPEAVGPPRAIPLDPDSFLTAEAIGDGHCTGLRLSRSGMSGEDLVLFRRDGDISAEGVESDAAVCALSTPEDGVRGFVGGGTRLSYKGAILLSCSQPADVWCELGPLRGRAVVQAPTALEIAFSADTTPRRVLINRRAADFAFDAGKRAWRVALPQGRSTLLATWE